MNFKNELKVLSKLDSTSAFLVFDFSRLKIQSFENHKAGQLKGFIVARLASGFLELKKEIKSMPLKSLC